MNISVKVFRSGAIALGALLAIGSLAACGNSSTTSSSASAAASATTTTSASGAGRRGAFRNPAERAKLVACLKQHGVTLPTRPPGAAGGGYGAGGSGGPPAGGSGGPPGGAGGSFFRGGASSKVQAAMKACGVSFGAGGRVNAAQRQAEVTKFVTCVKQHGYTLPKPNFSGTGPVFPAKIQSNAKFQAAAKSCSSLLRPPGAPQSAPAPSTA